jgi:hypothetical protein
MRLLDITLFKKYIEYAGAELKGMSPKIKWIAHKKSWNPHKMLLIKIFVIKNTNNYREMKKNFS